MSFLRTLMRSQTRTRTEPLPGDLIEFPRKGYQHWGVYVGDEKIVHLNVTDSKGGNTKYGKVQKDKLCDVATNGRWTVNNKYDDRYNPRPAQEIVDEAESMVGCGVDYNLITQNCEHFATKRRYGESESDQVDNGAKKGIGVATLAVGLYGMSDERDPPTMDWD